MLLLPGIGQMVYDGMIRRDSEVIVLHKQTGCCCRNVEEASIRRQSIGLEQTRMRMNLRHTD